MSKPEIERQVMAWAIVMVLTGGLLLWAGVAQGAEELHVVYAVTTRTVTAPVTTRPDDAGGKAKDETKTEDTTIVLGTTYFVRQGGAGRIVYDFKSRRITAMNPGARTYTDLSLFSDLGFRVSELKNRVFLGDALRKAGVKKGDDPFDLFEVASLLGVELPDSPDAEKAFDAKKEVSKEGVAFLRGKDLVARWAGSDQKVPPDYRGMFQRYVAYTCRVHPKILAELQAADSLPETLTFRFKELPKTVTVTWKLGQVTRHKAQDLSVPKDYTRAKESDDPLEDVLADPAALQVEDAAKVAKAAAEYAENALKNGQCLDAMLAVLEVGLRTGTTDKELAGRIGAAVKEDPDFLKLRSALGGQPTKERLDELNSIAAEKIGKGYLLNIFRANIESGMGDLASAEKHFLAALKGNPRIAGAYVDLGKLYMRKYRMDKAWWCWDAARRLCPKHFLLKQIDDLEARLLKDFPGWF